MIKLITTIAINSIELVVYLSDGKVDLLFIHIVQPVGFYSLDGVKSQTEKKTKNI